MTVRRHQQQFAALLDAHRGIVFKVAAMYARQRDDRDDLVQEICIQSWRSFPRFDPDHGPFSTWMYRIALNVAISQVRRDVRGHTLAHDALQDEHLETLMGAADVDVPDPRIAALHELIRQLDALNRALIMLYLEDRSYSEIADILGISETNVATKISRIKQKLRGQMTAAHQRGE